MGFLNIHPDNVQSAESQATQVGAFYQMGFLGWEFHCVFPDKCSLGSFPCPKFRQYLTEGPPGITWTNGWLNSLWTLLNLRMLNFKLSLCRKVLWQFHSVCGLRYKWVEREWGRGLVDGIGWNLVSGKVKIWKLDMVVRSALLGVHLLSGSQIHYLTSITATVSLSVRNNDQYALRG